MMKALAPKHLALIRHYIAGKTAKEAALLAGFAPGYARHASDKLVKNPLIAAEIERHRAVVAEATGYDAQKAMAELDEVIAHAKVTENTTAYARAVELRMKLNGLLVDRVDQRQVAAFRINISGIDPPAPRALPTLKQIFED